MNSGTEWPTATIQYRLNLPHALHPASHSLSALHTSRAATLHPEIKAVLHPSHCSKCGTYRFSGDHPPYLVGPSTRKKRRRTKSQHQKVLQRKCHSCGFSTDARTSPSVDSVPIQRPSYLSKTGAVQAIPCIKEIDQEPSPSATSRPISGTVQTTKSGPLPPLPGRRSHQKSSHTKTSTLKDMLSRDRLREEGVNSHKKRKEGLEGLAAFLREL